MLLSFPLPIGSHDPAFDEDFAASSPDIESPNPHVSLSHKSLNLIEPVPPQDADHRDILLYRTLSATASYHTMVRNEG
jgi:hypothetical protein